MKKPKPRYNTANEIRDKIDYFVRKAKCLSEEADELDRESSKAQAMGDFAHAEFTAARAARIHKQIQRINDVQLSKLKDKLAEWLTPPLPGVGIDERSIQR